MKKFHIGIVGAGLIAQEHALSLTRNSRVGEVTVFDADTRRAEEFGVKFRATVAMTMDALVGSCDLIWICTPPFAHLEPVLAACKAKLPVFCEKPLAHEAADARRIRAAVQRAGVPFFMGHSGRYTSAFIKMKSLVEDGAIGKLTQVWSTRLGYLNPQMAPPWRLSDKLSGGAGVELGIHEIDWCRWIGGDFANVAAVGSSKTLAPNKFQDTLTAVGTLKSGAIAKVEVNWANPRYLWQRGVEGTQGSLFFDDAKFNLVRLLRPGKDPQDFTVEPDWWKDRLTGENFAFRDQAIAVLSALEKHARPPVGIDDGWRALQAGLAMRKASTSGKVISVART